MQRDHCHASLISRLMRGNKEDCHFPAGKRILLCLCTRCTSRDPGNKRSELKEIIECQARKRSVLAAPPAQGSGTRRSIHPLFAHANRMHTKRSLCRLCRHLLWEQVKETWVACATTAGRALSPSAVCAGDRTRDVLHFLCPENTESTSSHVITTTV